MMTVSKDYIETLLRIFYILIVKSVTSRELLIPFSPLTAEC